MKSQQQRQPMPSISESAPSKDRKEEEKDDDGEEEDNELLDSSPLWHREDEGWELTWPIWHMLPRDERKALANRHGYKTIGEFEEYMSLQQTLDDSGVSRPQQAYPNELIYPQNKKETKVM